MAWRRNPVQHKKSQILLALILLAVLIIFVALLLLFRNESSNQGEQVAVQPPISATNEVVNKSEEVVVPVDTNAEAKLLQDALDKWVTGISGNASVVIASEDGTVLASHDPSRVYFGASIYKLYVAYAGYKQVDAGQVDPTEVYLNGKTRAECLDLMIRNSDSPCAEKLWAEIGKPELTQQLKSYGINNTNMSAITTTSADAATILSMISRGSGLSKSSQGAFLESMNEQIYRDTLNVSFENEKVYNKIGFNEQVEYHDTAIVEFNGGRRLIISVLTENVGTKNIIALGDAIRNVILAEN